jgi:hypothetical protein
MPVRRLKAVASRITRFYSIYTGYARSTLQLIGNSIYLACKNDNAAPEYVDYQGLEHALILYYYYLSKQTFSFT